MAAVKQLIVCVLLTGHREEEIVFRRRNDFWLTNGGGFGIILHIEFIVLPD